MSTDEARLEREVKRTCNRCYGRGVAVGELTGVEVVSIYGTAHKAGPNKHTDCGIDAAGPGWEWRSEP